MTRDLPAILAAIRARADVRAIAKTFGYHPFSIYRIAAENGLKAHRMNRPHKCRQQVRTVVWADKRSPGCRRVNVPCCVVNALGWSPGDVLTARVVAPCGQPAYLVVERVNESEY